MVSLVPIVAFKRKFYAHFLGHPVGHQIKTSFEIGEDFLFILIHGCKNVRK